MVEVEEAERLLQAALAASVRMRRDMAAIMPAGQEPLRAALAVLSAGSLPSRLRPLLLGLLDELVPLRARLDEELRADGERLDRLEAHRRAGRAYRRGERR